MTAHVLVLNAGSSSIKYKLIDADTGATPASGLVERIGEATGTLHHSGSDGVVSHEQRYPDHDAALRAVLDAFEESGPSLATIELAAVGHRVVHGGDRFSQPVLIDDELEQTLADLVPLAPLHNGPNLQGVQVARQVFPDLPHVGVFDTAFHQSMPPHAYTYAVPRAWREEHGVRRYGFHGTSHAYVSRVAAEVLGRDRAELNLIVLHLGNGASATAVCGGRSVDTSMGLTPLQGLVMGTRSGDIDPAIITHLERTAGLSAAEVDTALNRESGLLGLCGENDVREVYRLVDAGDRDAQLALDVYCYRIRGYVGAYYAALGRVDGIVFTAGVGENSPRTWSQVLDGLDSLGIVLDPASNEADSGEPRVVSMSHSRVAVLVVPTNEELEIARQATDLLSRR